MTAKTPVLRAAAEVLRTDAKLSGDFREQCARLLEALDACMAELEITEEVHRRMDRPFYSQGLEMTRAVIGASETPPVVTEQDRAQRKDGPPRPSFPYTHKPYA